jgi:drug/metabolite transporter (DMT)-like permease
MDLRALVLGLVFALIWSSAFTSARIIVEAAPPLTALSLRFFLSGLLGIAIALRAGTIHAIDQGAMAGGPDLRHLPERIVSGSEFRCDADGRGVTGCDHRVVMPLMVAAANWGLFQDKLPAMGVLGLIAGFAGVAIIMADRFGGGADLAGIAMCVLGVAALTVATLSMKSASSDGGNLLMVVGCN